MSKQASVDNILQTCVKRIELEVGALLGQTLSCSRHAGSYIGKDEYLARLEEQAVLTRMSVSGDLQDEAYVVVGLETAITFGGTLIMLPDEEMKSRIKAKDFDEEVADAFGEIGNIIAGVYTAVFLERLSHKLHCKKTAVAAFAPWEATEQTPFPERGFYLSTSTVKMNDRDLGKIEALFPVELFELSPPAASTTPPAGVQNNSPAQVVTGTPQPAGTPAAVSQTLSGADALTPAPAATTFSPLSPGAGAASVSTTPRAASDAAEEADPVSAGRSVGGAGNAGEICPLLLVAAETQEEANAFGVPLASRDLEILCLTFQDNLKEAVGGKRLQGVILVMREVGERGLASLIKVRSAVDPQTPLVVAGQQWTRRTVLQAVKYGARDILVIPAETEEILTKIRVHMPA